MHAERPGPAAVELPTIPFFIRGHVYADGAVVVPGRRSGQAFRTPDPEAVLDAVVCRDPDALTRDFARLSVSNIIEFLAATGEALRFDRNPLLQEACRIAARFSPLTAPVLEGCYRQLAALFAKDALHRIVENEIGARYLDGWVDVAVPGGRARVRAYGAKTLHLIAGNVPQIAAKTIIRGTLLKADNIIKLPSNDPLTATAILRTMHAVDPTHPVVQHWATLYWKGGAAVIEQALITPQHLDKVIAWGGAGAIAHIKQQVGSGIDLITLEPKFSIAIIGPEAFLSDARMEQVASQAAIDSAAFNQEACVSARTHYVLTTPERAMRYARLLYAAMQRQPPAVSTRPKAFPRELREQIDTLRYSEEFYDVVGGEDAEGAVITSLTGDRVEFLPVAKVVNVVPVESVEAILPTLSSLTQSVGIYPEGLKGEVADRLVARGVQRLVSLGRMADSPLGVPHDGMEVMRRAAKWIVDEISA